MAKTDTTKTVQTTVRMTEDLEARIEASRVKNSPFTSYAGHLCELLEAGLLRINTEPSLAEVLTEIKGLRQDVRIEYGDIVKDRAYAGLFTPQ